MMSERRYRERLQVVRKHYSHTPWIRPHDDDAPLMRSWQRSEALGLRGRDPVIFDTVERSQFQHLVEQEANLLTTARTELERLAHAVQRANCAVMLVNARAIVIDSLVDQAGAQRPLRDVARPGVNLDERYIGTTAPSIALSEGTPYLVGRDAHFSTSNRDFFCVAAPIDDPRGCQVGALNIAAYDSVPQFDVFSLVKNAAAGIERALFEHPEEGMLLHFHTRPELVGTVYEGILAVDALGRICGVNRAGASLLASDRGLLLDLPIDALIVAVAGRSDLRCATDQITEWLLSSGLLVYGRVSMKGRRTLVLRAHRTQLDAVQPNPLSDQAPTISLAATTPGTLRDAELELIQSTIGRLNGNVSAAARELGIGRATIYRKLTLLRR